MSTQTNLFAPPGPETAPEKSRPLPEKIQRAFKFIPNLFGVFANSPVLPEGYMGLEGTFEKGSLSAVERQIVLPAASVENSRRSCTAAHSTVLKAFLHVPADVVSAVRSNLRVSDRKLNALVALTKGVALKTMSNYPDHISPTELDPAFHAED